MSGLAYGIDKMAHEGAFKEVGKTIAVVAQSIPELQPTVHKELARRIVEAGGAIVSERSLGEVTYKSDYLVRNRIIAGLRWAHWWLRRLLKVGPPIRPKKP